ncbi:hypothetical protein M7I_2822 [Glarea lozoyensis 74030]|uniref:Uncharacterized protein n=1 Tax=Glarea lozoyensis (strain ATCC 74030 / MF5533) TaxID=1104152 RepID=H0EJU0_GLAL7|nr:hypothetical protein M7I_2822 [Glarea lozoyensis 74030]
MAASTVMGVRALGHEKPSLLESDHPVKRRGPSINIYSTSKNSEICLPSPSILAAQAFYIQQKAYKAPITPPEPENTTRKAQEVWQIQSAVPSSPDIASTLEQFKISARSTPESPDNDNTTSLVPPRRQSVATTAADVPFLYIHSHLRTWGQTYLSNKSSADAFINPMVSRRLSMMLSAKTSPKDRDSLKTPLSRLGSGPTPIHVTYALHFLPVLAALLLSGHVRKGDTIDLPLPNPDSWAEVVGWVYTGNPVALSDGARENVEYLGGVVEGA